MGDIFHSNCNREFQHKIARTSRSQAFYPLIVQLYLSLLAFSCNHTPSGCPSRLLTLSQNLKLHRAKHTLGRTVYTCPCLWVPPPISLAFTASCWIPISFYFTTSDSLCKYKSADGKLFYSKNINFEVGKLHPVIILQLWPHGPVVCVWHLVPDSLWSLSPSLCDVPNTIFSQICNSLEGHAKVPWLHIFSLCFLCHLSQMSSHNWPSSHLPNVAEIFQTHLWF